MSDDPYNVPHYEPRGRFGFSARRLAWIMLIGAVTGLLVAFCKFLGEDNAMWSRFDEMVPLLTILALSLIGLVLDWGFMLPCVLSMLLLRTLFPPVGSSGAGEFQVIAMTIGGAAGGGVLDFLSPRRNKQSND
jgi:hypothetical protein